MPALTSPMKAMNRPIPAAMACLSELGIASITISRTRRKVSRKKTTPETNTAANATCHDTPRPSTTERKKKFSPMAGASATG